MNILQTVATHRIARSLAQVDRSQRRALGTFCTPTTSRGALKRLRTLDAAQRLRAVTAEMAGADGSQWVRRTAIIVRHAHDVTTVIIAVDQAVPPQIRMLATFSA